MPRFYLRTPSAVQRRRFFRIYKDGHPLAEPRIKAINDNLASQKIDLETATIEARKVLAQLRADDQAASQRETAPAPNLDLLARASADYVKRRISARSKRMALASLRRVVTLLGPRIIFSTAIEELQQLIDRQSVESQPKLAVFLNVLLEHTNRPERVLVPSAPDPAVLYLTKEEFEQMLPHLPEFAQNLLTTGFATGARLGEVFGLQRMGRTASVQIMRQLYPDGKYGSPKGSRPGKPRMRWTPVMEFGRAAVREWIAELEQMDEDKKLALRNLDWAEIVRTACRAAFPKRPAKHLSFRDIRHCYAIYWLDRGATLRHVAQSMGNSEAVVRKHYSGFVQTDDAEIAMLSLEHKKVGS